ncbi:type II toxin-antitoxin system HicB family antitoxin [Deinococcus multiflagellatus]|uniref:Type II toxin-antitoxin system HicB family antitoxin n=1 Tax=Deinococcus multiflagellatus TaxID=1656887 RepID=A0ABW1ZK50_9DEIO|nr:type II toxin-antitoxin system HicB family antitoxin [Deinococcus multiflagellatus]MBZ9713730.1 helix-turn-helix transcriptional regulator [Deinococcus multiflagellatus]
MKYLTIVTSSGPQAWHALVPDLTCIANAKSRERLIELARESIAVALEDGPRPPQAASLDDLAPDVRADVPADAELLLLEPAPMNPVSAEIERALERAGVSQAELARRIGSSPAGVNRLVNPFYWGHSLDLLRRVAAALNADLQVQLTGRAS